MILNGIKYELIIRPWIKGEGRFEVIKYPVPFKNLWKRISYKEYKTIFNDQTRV